MFVSAILISRAFAQVKMEKVESALDVLSRAATMVQPCPAYPNSDSEGFGKCSSLVYCETI